MALFGSETERIIRTKWKNPVALSQELWALFQGDIPITQNAPITITQENPDDPRPRLTFDLPPGGDGPVIRFHRGDEIFDFGPEDFGGGGGGGTDLGKIDFPGGDPTTKDAATPAAIDTPFTLYGEVQAQRSGAIYDVKVWAKSPWLGAPAIGIIPVRQAQIATDDVIPTNTSVLVVCFPGEHLGVRTILDAVMQVPVFLANPT